MKKLTHEFVDNYFKQNNCVLLDNYENARKLMKYICKCGDQSVVSYGNFKQGNRCKKCAIYFRANKKRKSYDYIYNYFKKHGCELLSNVYIQNHKPLDYKCVCGKKAVISFAQFQKGTRCKSCGIKKSKEKQKFSYDYIYGYFDKHNCKLLSKEYNNVLGKLEYRCQCGNDSITTFVNFKKGVRCRLCAVAKQTGFGSHFYNIDREYVERIKRSRVRCRNLIIGCMRTLKISKNGRTRELLGYSPLELDNNLKSHINYEYTMNAVSGGDKFSVDHIFPIKAFVDHNLDEEKFLWLINSLDNLQPMPLSENCRKNDIYDIIEFKKWVFDKGIIIR